MGKRRLPISRTRKHPNASSRSKARRRYLQRLEKTKAESSKATSEKETLQLPDGNEPLLMDFESTLPHSSAHDNTRASLLQQILSSTIQSSHHLPIDQIESRQSDQLSLKMGKQQPKARTRKNPLHSKRARGQRERRERELQQKLEKQALEEIRTNVQIPEQSQPPTLDDMDVYSVSPDIEESRLFEPIVTIEPLPSSPIQKLNSYSDLTASTQYLERSQSPSASNTSSGGTKSLSTVTKPSSTVTSKPSPTLTSTPVKLTDVSMSSSSDFVVAVEETRKATQFLPINVICNMGHVIEQARAAERHSHECHYGGVLVLTGSTQRGLALIATYRCSQLLCPANQTITSHPEVQRLHLQSVLGVKATGSSYAKERDRFTAQGMKYMSNQTFCSYAKVFEGLNPRSPKKSTEKTSPQKSTENKSPQKSTEKRKQNCNAQKSARDPKPLK